MQVPASSVARRPHGTPSRTVLRTVLVAAVAVLLGGLFAPVPASAQSTEVIGGRLSDAGAPVPGVRIAVSTPAGDPVGEAVSGDDGAWEVPLPGPGEYRIVLDVDSLPDGVTLRDPTRTEVTVNVFENARSAAVFALGEPIDQGPTFARLLAQNAVNGLKFGLIIAMTAVGLSLIFGTTGLVNFAHGDLVTLGAFLAFVLNVTFGLRLLVAAPLAILLSAAFSGGLDRFLWRPLRARQTGLIAMLVVSIGLGFVIRHLVLLFMGGSRNSYSEYTLQSALEFGLIRLQPTEIVVMLLSVLLLTGVGLMLNRTRLGKAMRAVADERDLAESSGIDVQRVVLAVWVLGGALTGIGGVFLGITESVDYLMGFRLLLLMFAGVILGGLGSAYGAMVGGVVVGLVSEVSTVWFSSQIKYVWSLLVLAIILLVRPQGILGRRERIG